MVDFLLGFCLNWFVVYLVSLVLICVLKLRVVCLGFCWVYRCGWVLLFCCSCLIWFYVAGLHIRFEFWILVLFLFCGFGFGFAGLLFGFTVF